jgi:hypothetical protein
MTKRIQFALSVLMTVTGLFGAARATEFKSDLLRLQSNGAPSVEIIEVKNLGVSAANESLSVIQVKWKAQSDSAKSFEVKLEVNYADGASDKAITTADDPKRAARFEFRTLHFSSGKPGAELKSYRVTITTDRAESASKQGSL